MNEMFLPLVLDSFRVESESNGFFITMEMNKIFPLIYYAYST